MKLFKTGIAFVLSALLIASGPVLAQKKGGGKGGGGGTSGPSLVVQPWMSPEVGDAWKDGYKGQDVTITVVDDFTSRNRFSGNLTGGSERLRHGEWTLKEASMVAPLATMRSKDFNSGTTVSLNTGLNVLNLSYGMMANSGLDGFNWSAQERSIIDYAKQGRAVISKAAGNDAVAVGSANSKGTFDYLNRDLIGAQSAIFVGALSANSTPLSKASLASYSNFAGDDVRVQDKFIVVGVESSKTGLAGTSFAAPIVSGYAAILGSKFTSASPTQITNQLLNTAREDTISGYKASIHGRGEASLTRALAPVNIQ
jgi:subtilisin family serine protease